MTAIILIGLGAGLTSSLIFGSAFTASPLAVVLSYLTPLPLMIAGLGWGWRTAALGSGLGMVVAGAAFSAEAAVLFALTCAAPATWLTQLAMLSRQDGGGPVEWYPPGRLLTRVSWAASGLVLAAMFYFGPDAESFRANAIVPVENWLYPMLEGGDASPEETAAYAHSYASILLVGAASMWALVMLANLWLAGRVIRTSKRLQRPWPDLGALDMPRVYGAVLAVMIVVSLTPGSPGMVAIATANIWGSAYLLVGLAVIHTITAGLAARAAILTVVYLAVVLILYAAVLVALIGLLDPFLRIRARFGARRGGPPARPD